MNFCFDDLYSYRFMYDCHSKEIEISFDSYYNEDSDYLVEKDCTLSICGWTTAKGRLSKDKHWSSNFEYFVGIVDMILKIEEDDDEKGSYLTMTVMTNDDRYVDWYFENAKIKFVVNCRVN